MQNFINSNGSTPEAHSTGLSSCVLLSRFYLLQDIAFTHKAASFCQLLIQKMLQPFITPVLSRFISVKIFSVSQV